MAKIGHSIYKPVTLFAADTGVWAGCRRRYTLKEVPTETVDPGLLVHISEGSRPLPQFVYALEEVLLTLNDKRPGRIKAVPVSKLYYVDANEPLGVIYVNICRDVRASVAGLLSRRERAKNEKHEGAECGQGGAEDDRQAAPGGAASRRADAGADRGAVRNAGQG